MAGKTKIGWTESTFNPWWGCTKISPGCEHCYAETYAHRYGFGWGNQAVRRKLSEGHWNEPLKWNKQAAKGGVRKKVFCSSMADVFEDNPQVITERNRLWSVIEATPNLDWQLLTKRPQNVNAMVPARWHEQGWPSNVWIGTSIENQASADTKILELLNVNSAVRFLSCEPLIGAVDIRTLHHDRIQWLIIGGESGPGARPMEIEWARSLKDQCVEGGIRLFVKQLGGVRDHREQLEDLPEDLRIREFPNI